MKILVIIPARGGSKGIPKKNVRSLAGRPLISYSIQMALQSRYRPDVFVSTDDEEIAFIAQNEGASIHYREPSLADDRTTLDEVIANALGEISDSQKTQYDLVVSIQATSPLLKTETLDRGIEEFQKKKGLDTLLTAREERHLTWEKKGEQFVPAYSARVNRQYLKPYWVETGGFVICRPKQIIEHQTRFGANASLVVVPEDEALDIDDYSDWNACEYSLRRKKILFCPIGHESVGLGHVSRALTLATSIQSHKVEFLVTEGNLSAKNLIESHFFSVRVCREEQWLEEVFKIAPALVVNDRLDTQANEILALKKRNIKVVNFEDLGPGSMHADLVINALYKPEGEYPTQFYFGERLFCAREEFVTCPGKKIEPTARNILLSFGGTDPGHLTEKTIAALSDWVESNECRVKIILGMGVDREIHIPSEKWIIRRNVKNMAREMLEADVIFTSAGRTVYEVACVGTPAIVLAQNERELLHPFPREESGFVYLGLGSQVSEEDLLAQFKRVWDDFSLREKMSHKMLSKNLKSNRRKVIRMIENLLEEE